MCVTLIDPNGGPTAALVGFDGFIDICDGVGVDIGIDRPEGAPDGTESLDGRDVGVLVNDAAVGFAVGIAVGVLVGVAVGILVGVAVGVLVGVAVGVSVGAAVGVIVGVAVGL